MKYVLLDYDEAHATVAENRFLRWNGWDIVTWRKDAAGYYDQRGEFRGTWGITFRYPLRDDGKWRIPVNYVRNR